MPDSGTLTVVGGGRIVALLLLALTGTIMLVLHRLSLKPVLRCVSEYEPLLCDNYISTKYCSTIYIFFRRIHNYIHAFFFCVIRFSHILKCDFAHYIKSFHLLQIRLYCFLN